jgi:hypothetical protein
MIDSCAELLLSGILAINGKSLDYDANSGITYKTAKVSFVLPDRYSIEGNPCINEQIHKKDGVTMKSFLKKID